MQGAIGFYLGVTLGDGVETGEVCRTADKGDLKRLVVVTSKNIWSMPACSPCAGVLCAPRGLAKRQRVANCRRYTCGAVVSFLLSACAAFGAPRIRSCASTTKPSDGLPSLLTLIHGDRAIAAALAGNGKIDKANIRGRRTRGKRSVDYVKLNETVFG